MDTPAEKESTEKGERNSFDDANQGNLRMCEPGRYTDVMHAEPRPASGWLPVLGADSFLWSIQQGASIELFSRCGEEKAGRRGPCVAKPRDCPGRFSCVSYSVTQRPALALCSTASQTFWVRRAAFMSGWNGSPPSPGWPGSRRSC